MESQRLSWASLVNPSGLIMRKPAIGWPDPRQGDACIDFSALTSAAAPTRTISPFADVQQSMFPFNRKVMPPNMRLFVVSPGGIAAPKGGILFQPWDTRRFNESYWLLPAGNSVGPQFRHCVGGPVHHAGGYLAKWVLPNNGIFQQQRLDRIREPSRPPRRPQPSPPQTSSEPPPVPHEPPRAFGQSRLRVRRPVAPVPPLCGRALGSPLVSVGSRLGPGVSRARRSRDCRLRPSSESSTGSR
jgi:hypothetical protein